MKIHFVGSPKPAAKDALQHLIDAYGQSEFSEADYIVAIGGDGTTLKVLHSLLEAPSRPVFAMRLQDSVGALGNRYDLRNLRQRLNKSRRVSFSPLQATVICVNGATETLLGINEVVVSRQQLQAAKLSIRLGERETVHLAGDGVLISTPIGSTGYNRSAGGPTLMLESQLLAVTGLSVCRPTHWSNIVIEDRVPVEIQVSDPIYRPVRIETVVREARDISSVQVSLRKEKTLTLLREDDVNRDFRARYWQN